MHGKAVLIVAAHFRSHWVKRSANADRKSLGKFDPAFVSDQRVVPHIQAGQVLVDLQEVDQKSMVSGGLLNWPETHGKQCTGQGSLRVVVLSSVWVKILPRVSLR